MVLPVDFKSLLFGFYSERHSRDSEKQALMIAF